MTKNKRKRNFHWTNPKLIKGRVSNYGNGIFARKEVKKGEMCAIFGGHVVSLRDEMKLPSEYNDTGIQISNEFVISTMLDKELADNFNHSCEPNAGIKGQIFLQAMRNIKKGEQVTFDYATCLFNNPKVGFFYKTRCFCGSKICRGYITGNDWKKPELQKKYAGYFQWYLQEKINNIKK